jgi:hypothetical protein
MKETKGKLVWVEEGAGVSRKELEYKQSFESLDGLEISVQQETF